MYSDISGYAPEWHHWLRSGLAFALGIVLVSTGVFTPIGAALIGMGVNSIISGYISESSGGDFDSGYYGGAITGALCGLSAGLGGGMIVSAGESGTISGMIGGLLISASGGALGGFVGTAYTDFSNTGEVNMENAIISAGICGSINMFASVGSAFTEVLSYSGQRILVGGFTFSVEGIIDGILYIINEIYNSVT